MFRLSTPFLVAATLALSPVLASAATYYGESSRGIGTEFIQPDGDFGFNALNPIYLPNGILTYDDFVGPIPAGIVSFSGAMRVDCTIDGCAGDSGDRLLFELASGFEITGASVSMELSVVDQFDPFDFYGIGMKEITNGAPSIDVQFAKDITTGVSGERISEEIVGGTSGIERLGAGVFALNPFIDTPDFGRRSAEARWTVSFDVVDNNPPVSQVPLPASVLLLGAAVAALGALGRRKPS